MPDFEWQFTLVLLTNGIMIGLMYALIALGFVLIYKATDAINFAQGEFVMFAGFLAAGAAEMAGAPFWVSALIAIGGMIALGFGLERVVLRPMIGRPVIAVVMAMLRVDNQLALVGLKVFPVVILGGLDSILGAVIGGLIVGIVENLAAGYLDPYVGGGTKDFAPYVLMILVLMIRPEGIFGRRRIERV